MQNKITAVLIIIGDEILSGRTQDTNLKYLAEKLGEKGIALREVRVVPDIEGKIIKAVNDLRAEHDYVFTTGGIGPTHDDITAECVAKAFGVKYEQNAEAYEILVKHYGGAEHLNEARLKMTMMPAGVKLIHNPVSGAPGFNIGNVYVMAGVPKIMQGMLDGVLAALKGGAVVYSNTIICGVAESKIAEALGNLQKQYPGVGMGSYPRFQPSGVSVSLVLRSSDTELLKTVTRALIEIVTALDGKPPELNLQVGV
jgi:molybdenum cofactor synthesis domain-containing protein